MTEKHLITLINTKKCKRKISVRIAGVVMKEEPGLLTGKWQSTHVIALQYEQPISPAVVGNTSEDWMQSECFWRPR